MPADRVGRFLRLPAADRALLVRAVLTLLAARLAIWVLPFRVVRRILTRRTARKAAATGASGERIGWAIDIAKRFVPNATCLPQAIAAESLLRRSGLPALMHIGVKKSVDGKLDAHAWVESEGHIIVGDLAEEFASYTPLPPLPAA